MWQGRPQPGLTNDVLALVEPASRTSGEHDPRGETYMSSLEQVPGSLVMRYAPVDWLM